jgi:hypothetical protein
MTREAKMETIQIWEGTKSWLRGDENSEYEVYEFVGREIGMLKVVDEDDARYSTTYRVYETETGGIVIHSVELAPVGEEQQAAIFVYDNLYEAAEDGFAYILETMRVLDQTTYLVEDWRKEWIERGRMS